MIVYSFTKFDNSSFGRPRDITGARKFKMGHVTLITPLLRVICPLYVGLHIAYPCTAVQEIWLVPTKI